MGLSVRKEGTSDQLRDVKDPQQTNERELAPTEWVTVKESTTADVQGSFTGMPAAYVLCVYTWMHPPMPPTEGRNLLSQNPSNRRAVGYAPAVGTLPLSGACGELGQRRATAVGSPDPKELSRAASSASGTS